MLLTSHPSLESADNHLVRGPGQERGPKSGCWQHRASRAGLGAVCEILVLGSCLGFCSYILRPKELKQKRPEMGSPSEMIMVVPPSLPPGTVCRQRMPTLTGIFLYLFSLRTKVFEKSRSHVIARARRREEQKRRSENLPVPAGEE
ncbi:Plexin-C1 [Manis pentadactyla]|nr:Plexin-C1 [Manis pentadactyla]